MYLYQCLATCNPIGVLLHFSSRSLQGQIQDFSKEVDFCKGGGVTIRCLITKICELGACFLYFSYVLAQNRE